MAHKYKLVALILCLALLLGMAGCGDDPVIQAGTSDPTAATAATAATEATAPTESTGETTVPTDPPEPDYAPLYAEAKAAVQQAQDLTLTITLETKRSVAGEVFERKTTQTVSITGYGTDAVTCVVTELVEQDDSELEFSEYYDGQNVYLTCYENGFSSAMTSEEYFDRLLPAVLLDETLYETITAKESDDGSSKLVFTDPTAGESWAVPPYGELQTATGTARLNADGTLAGTGYCATYTQNATEVTVVASVDIALNAAPADDIAPDELAGCTPITCIDGPKLLELAIADIYSAESITSSASTTMITYAGGAVLTQQEYCDTYGSGRNRRGKKELTYQFEDSSGYSEEYSLIEKYYDNTYTMIVDNGEPETSYVNPDTMENYTKQSITAWFWLPEYLADITITDLGSFYLLEMTGTEQTGELYCDLACETFFPDNVDILDEYATSYSTVTMEAYLSLDKYTGLPTAFGHDYVGEHVIDGITYSLTDHWTQSLFLGSNTSYETITDEPLLQTKPDEPATPLFYHVTGPDGQEMWLLGTIHVGDSRTSYLPQEIYDALYASDALAVEVDVIAYEEQLETDKALATKMAMSIFYLDGSTLADHLSPEVYEAAVRLLKAAGSYNDNTLAAKPALAESVISYFLLQQSYILNPYDGVDRKLLELAKDEGMTILDIESPVDHMQMPYRFSGALQELLLASTMASDTIEYGEQTMELFEQWCIGDEATLRESLTDDLTDIPEEELALYEEYIKAMSTDRNIIMLDAAKNYLESGETIFYAVGLAHVLAEDGLVNTLRDAGYTVEAVNYAEST